MVAAAKSVAQEWESSAEKGGDTGDAVSAKARAIALSYAAGEGYGVCLQHTATHCNTLQHTTTHCNILQHIATHCNTLNHSRMLQVRSMGCVSIYLHS